MEFFTDDVMRDLLAQSLETAELGADGFHDVGSGPGLDRGHVHRLAHDRRPQGSVVDDVTRIRNHPLVPAGIPIYGYVYDVKTGRLVEIPDATAAGRASLSQRPPFHKK